MSRSPLLHPRQHPPNQNRLPRPLPHLRLRRLQQQRRNRLQLLNPHSHLPLYRTPQVLIL
jgi:hypothetical protein